MAEKKVVYKIEFNAGELTKQLNKVTSEIDELDNSLKRMKKDNQKGTAEWANTTLRMKEHKAELNKVTKAIIATNKRRKASVGTLESYKAQLVLVNQKIDKLTKSELADVRVGGRLLKLKKALNDELKRNEKLGGVHTRNVGNYTSVWGKLGTAIKSAAASLGLFLGIQQLFRGFRSAITLVKDFTQSVAVLESVLGATKPEMKELTDLALELGRTTKYTASEVINLQEALARLGFDTQEIKNMTADVLNLATALNTDLRSSAELVGSTLRAFQLDSKDATDVSDLFAQATRRSALSFEKLSVALPIVGTVAKNAGVSLKTLVAQLGVAADRGMDASMSATSLRKVYLSLAKSGMSYEEALKRINNATDKNKESLKLFGVRASTVGTILATSSEDVDKLTSSLDNAAGATKEMADIQMNTLEGALLRVKSAWESFLINLDKTSGFSNKLKDSLNWLAENFDKVMSAVGKLAKAFIILKSAQLSVVMIEGLIVAWQGLRAALKGAKTAQLSLNAAQMKNVYVAIAAAVLYLGTVIYDYATKLTTAEKAQKSFNDELAKTVGESESLFWQLQNTTKGTEDYIKLINEINQKYGEYLPYLLDEKSSLEEIQKAREYVNKGIEEAIKLRILEESRSDIYTKKVKNEIEADKEYKKQMVEKKILTEQQIRAIKNTIDEQSKLTGNVDEYKKAIEKTLDKELDWKKKGFWSKGMQTDLNRYVNQLIQGARDAELAVQDLNSVMGQTGQKPMFDFGPPSSGSEGGSGDDTSDDLQNAYNKSLEQSLVNLEKYKVTYQKMMDENLDKLNSNNEKILDSRKELLDKQLAVTLQSYLDEKSKLKEKLDNEKITEEDYNNAKSIAYQNYLIKKEGQEYKYEKDVEKIKEKSLKIEEDNFKKKLDLDSKMNDVRYNLGVVSTEEYMKEIERIKIEKLKKTNAYIIATEKEQTLMIQSIKLTSEQKIDLIEYKAAKDRIKKKYTYVKGKEKQMSTELLELEIEYLKKSKEYTLLSEEDKLIAINFLRREYQQKSQKAETENRLTWETMTRDQQMQFMMGTYHSLAALANQMFANQIEQICNQADIELDLLKTKYENEKDIRQSAYDEELMDLELKWKSGQITEQQYLKEKYATQKAFDKKEISQKKIQAAKELTIKKQALEEQKKYQRAQVYINAASAIISAWANTIPYPAGAVYAGLQSAIIMASAASEITTINSQHLAGGGILEGNLHTQGGIQMGNNQEAEGGEYVINRASTERYKPVLDYINSAGNSTGNSGDVKEIIDYNKLISGIAAAVNDKKVILTERDLVENENSRINIESKTTF